ncbi:alpha/beta hydrolase [uncultured Amnibacterium sp.]|uniref:alpha/beta hydrolase n=1 Tax=uncultured Amnibacterium sp. TaxID=1631851 RepID=UPI0035CA79E7
MVRLSTAAVRTAAASAIAAGGVVIAGAVFAGAVTTSVARRVVMPPKRRREDTAVLQVQPAVHRIRFAITADSVLPGRYSFWFDGGAGHARIGEVLERTSGGVVRELLQVDSGDIAEARLGRFNGWVYRSPADLGVPFEEVRIQTTLGAAPAWVIPAETPEHGAPEHDSHRWAVLVHGRATVRQEVLRAVPVLRSAGYSCLLISYRNDGEAPQSADRRYALGDTEWLDVESAMLAALDRGAQQIVLMGWSMGGAIALQASTRSRIASVLTGVILESPVIDWTETLLRRGESMSLPGPVKRGVLALISSRWGGLLTGQDEPIDLGRLDFVARAGELTLPILVLHSDDDDWAPVSGSRRLAAERPDLVRLELFRLAHHTRLWNADPVRWEGAIRSFLAGPGGGTPAPVQEAPSAGGR